MKKFYKESFDKKLLRAVGVVAALFAINGAFAAVSSDGCDNDDNEFINPEIALCSTHVFNIGETNNPTTDDQRQYMNDVVALKTTIMTQQMYKQYEYLEATLKRFKTQLEKAVLTTKIQVASGDGDSAGSSSFSGINTSNSTSSFRSSDRNIFIAGVNNCNNELSTQKVYECLNNNLNTIYNASNNGQNVTSELKKQLENDYKVASDNCECQSVTKRTDCTKNMSKKTFRECLDSMRNLVRKGNEEATKAQTMMNRYNPYGV